MTTHLRTLTKKAISFLLVPLAVCFLVLADTATAQPTPVDLGTLGGPTSSAVAVNARGEVVGNSDTADGRLDPFVWTVDRGLVGLGTLGGYARAVNDSGQIVGEAVMPDGATRAFSWTAAGGIIDLGALGLIRSLAWSVNASGHVVGSVSGDDGFERAFSWTAAGGMIDLGTLGGPSSSAISGLTDFGRTVNNAGQVVGSSATVSGASHAFLWTAAGGMIDLGTLRGGYSYAMSVNERGEVVGFSDGSAFLWSASRGMIDLGTLGVAFCYATEINDNGQVIGQCQTTNGQNHAFSWTPERGMVDLGTLGGDMSTATAVNASGMVVGYSYRGDGSGHAFSWTEAGGLVDLGTLAGQGGSYALAINDRGDIVGGSHIPGHLIHATLWPTADTTPPEITIAVQGGGKIWPPDGKMIPVTFTGTITDMTSTISEVTFSVSDEYGRVQPSGRVTLVDGRFSVAVRLEARRLGSDRDGRRYVMHVTATDTVGNRASNTAAVLVPHDSKR